MTTKPKARKFRIRRSAAASQPGTGAPSTAPGNAAMAPQRPVGAAPNPDSQNDMASAPEGGPNPEQAPETRSGQVSSAREMGSAQTIDEIRKEGLTGRQLRMARRMAQKHGLAPTSDFDAVRLLRVRGIDPFQRANILELVATNGRPQTASDETADAAASGASGASGGRVQLPQTMPITRQTMPSTDMSPADRRAEEIMSIQRDIGRRRRRKLMLLMSRLMAFVMLPTIVVGYYFYAIATPMYSTKSAFLILSADGGGSIGGLGGLLPSQFATSQDAIATQEYLQSKDAMLRLDGDVGFRSHFNQLWIDPLQRLEPDASNESAYSLYKKYVKLGYDPTEGVIRMEVSTAAPAVSATFSEHLITYAEERVDQLSQEKRQDAVKIAIESLDHAKADRRGAQQMLVSLQEGSILDPEGEIAGIRSLVGTVELQMQEKQLALNVQNNNSRPNRARVAALESEIQILQAELTSQKSRLTQATEGESSLASKTAAIQMAQADLATSDLVLQSALEAKRQSEIEANKQVRYLTVSVRPLPSQDASYPRAFENTILAFLIFSGIYLMISLTASVLREQVSS